MLLILQSTTRPQKPRSSALFHSGLLPVEPEDPEPDDADEADDPDDETTDTRPDRIAAVLLFLPRLLPRLRFRFFPIVGLLFVD